MSVNKSFTVTGITNNWFAELILIESSPLSTAV